MLGCWDAQNSELWHLAVGQGGKATSMGSVFGSWLLVFGFWPRTTPKWLRIYGMLARLGHPRVWKSMCDLSCLVLPKINVAYKYTRATTKRSATELEIILV